MELGIRMIVMVNAYGIRGVIGSRHMTFDEYSFPGAPDASDDEHGDNGLHDVRETDCERRSWSS